MPRAAPSFESFDKLGLGCFYKLRPGSARISRLGRTGRPYRVQYRARFPALRQRAGGRTALDRREEEEEEEEEGQEGRRRGRGEGGTVTRHHRLHAYG